MIALLLSMIYSPIVVIAQSVSMTVSSVSTIQRGNEFTVTIGVSNAPTLYGIDAALSYDRTKITLLRAEGLNGFVQPTVGTRFNTTNNAGRRGTYNMVRLVFRATSSFVVGDTTTIRVSDIKLSDLTKDLIGNNLSWSITMINPPLSSNANLSTLVIDEFDLDFNPEITTYQIDLENQINQIVIDAKPADSSATVNLESIYSLAVGSNRIEIVVIAANGTTKTYQLTIVRSDQVPTVTIDNLVDAIYRITTDQIQLIMPIDGMIENDILQVVKEANKILIVLGFNMQQELSYKWQLDGRSMEPISSINTNITIPSLYQPQIDQASNHVKGVSLALMQNDAYPSNTKIGVKVDQYYQDGQSLRLYSYDVNKESLKNVQSSITVVDGWAWFDATSETNLLLTAAEIKDISTSFNWYWVSMVQFVMLIGLLIVVFKKRKQP